MIDLRKRALENPDRPVYIMGGSNEVITALQFEERANQCSHLFRHLGLQIGDHVAIFMENNRYFLEICSAAGRSGLIYTPISTYLKAAEIEYIVNNSGAKAFFTSKIMYDATPLPKELMPNVISRLMVGGVADDFASYEDKLAGYPKTPIEDQMAGQDMLYSSGTTGMPKAVKMTYEPMPYGEITDQAKMVIALYGFDENTVYLSPAPLYHAAPLRFTLLALYAGGTAIIMERFDALESLALIEKYKVTHSQWVPTMFVRMLKLPEQQRLKYDVSSQKIAIHAAAPIPIPVKEKMIEWWGPVLFEYYAGTEANGLTAITSEEWLNHKGSVGRAFIGTAHILDQDGNELPPGEPGLIYFGDGQEFEYHGDPEKTNASRSPQGWSTINDIGYLDEEGYLYLTDRATNMIISGGVNIYPQEAENVLVMHPKVMDAAVIGIPNEDFGEEVKGVVQPRDMSDAGPEMEQELIAYCRSKLSKIKCPASIDFEAELPRTATGKLLKRLLKDRYWQNESNI
jgi:acyl-CoA synthetase (AMP-forming)/AMP-acid ligase II